jgi:hypothetical protein
MSGPSRRAALLAAFNESVRAIAIMLIPLMGALAVFVTAYIFLLQPILLTAKLAGLTLLDRLTGPRRARQARLTFEQARARSADEAAFLAAALDERLATAEAAARAVPRRGELGPRRLVTRALIAQAVVIGVVSLLAARALGGPLSAALVWEALLVGLKVGGLIGLVCLLFAISAATSATAEARLARRAFSLEAERVRDIFEVAGGLTLVEHEELRGALSDDEALRGALTRSPWGASRSAPREDER